VDVLAGAAELLQHAFAVPTHPWVAGLHALSGVAILGTGVWLAHDAWPGSRRAAVPAVY
jgi:hypothetical protein